MSLLSNDASVVIKGSCVVVWDSEDRKADPENPMRDRNIYKDINFKEKFLQELAETANSLFRNFKKTLRI